MSKTKILGRMFAVATLATMFGTGVAYAQTESATGSNAKASASASTTSKVSKADEKVMKDIAYANLSEIAAGKVALSNSNNDEVKKFAQKMIDDHTNAQKELQQLADAKGVTLPTEPDVKHKTELKMMSALTGAKFDKAYMKEGGLADHRNTDKLLAKAASKASDPDLKALVTKVKPVVDQHLSMAQNISKDTSSTNMSGSSMGSAGTSGNAASGSSGSSASHSNSSGGTSGSSNSTTPH